MSKTLRFGFALVAVIAIGLVAAVAVFVYTADYNRYKGLIEKAVMDAAGRQLVIKGDVAIAMSLPPELSAPVLGPAGLLVPFIKAGARNQHPCDVEELKNKIHSIYR